MIYPSTCEESSNAGWMDLLRPQLGFPVRAKNTKSERLVPAIQEDAANILAIKIDMRPYL